MTRRRTIEVGPFAVHFTNRNVAMSIPAHSHTAEVTACFVTAADEGLPVFQWSHDLIQSALTEACAHVFPRHTNERIADELFYVIDGVDFGLAGGPYAASRFVLMWSELAVRGVPDAIGHANAWTRYRVERRVPNAWRA